MKQPEDKINEEWNDDEKRQIGNRISQLRRDKGMNQSELAEILGITVNSVSNMENGNTVAKSKRLLQISEIFEVSVDYMTKCFQYIDKEGHVFIDRQDCDGLDESGVAVTQQPRCIDRSQAIKKIGEVTDLNLQDKIMKSFADCFDLCV